MQLWEEYDAHTPVTNHTKLISNGRHFREVYWPLQPQPVQTELVSSTSPICQRVQAELVSPTSPICQPNAGFQPVQPSVEPTVPTQENLGASCTPIPSPSHSRQSSRAPSRRPSTPPRDQATRRSLSPPPVVSIRTPSLSDEEARQRMKAWIETSPWLHKDEKEPLVGGPGVPTCALQLAGKGQSISCWFLVAEKDRKGKILGYKCASDPSSTRDRLHRAIGRERVKYYHRPFKCPKYHDPNW